MFSDKMKTGGKSGGLLMKGESGDEDAESDAHGRSVMMHDVRLLPSRGKFFSLALLHPLSIVFLFHYA